MKKYRQTGNFYIQEDEEFLIKDIVPEHYIENNIDKNNVKVDYAIRFLQNSLNYILSSFINGGFSHAGYLLYPFAKDVSEDNIKRIKSLNKIAVLLNNNGYDFSDSIKKYKERVNSRDFAAILSALYSDFSLIKSKNAKPVSKPRCAEFDIKTYKKSDLNYLRPLSELKEYADNKLKLYLAGFYLHGSLATKDYIKGWSDVDTLTVISKKTISNPESLLKLRNLVYHMRYFFYRIDPLQHHGSTIISEHDLENYCQTYFPVQVFRYANSFFQDDKISKFKSRDFSSESLKSLFWFVNYFRKLKFEKRLRLESYDSKTMLHSITLFPTMYLQSRGILTYKKFSFGIAKKDFKKEDWRVIEQVSSIRSGWKDYGAMPLADLFSKINPLLYYQLNSRVSDLFKSANKIDAKNIVNGMFELSEEAWSRVKKDAKNKQV